VRNLKRALESAVMKLNVLRLTGGTLSDSANDSGPDIPYRIQGLQFPLRLEEKLLTKLVSRIDDSDSPPEHMYV